MSTNFPTSIDVFIARTNKAGISESSNTTTIWASVVNNLQDAVSAIQAQVGISGSPITTSHDYLIKSAVNPGHTHTGSAVSLSATQTWTQPQTFSGAGAGLAVTTNATVAGLITVGGTATGMQAYIKSGVITVLPLVVDALVGQTANLFEARVNGTALATIGANGIIKSTGVISGIRTVTSTQTLLLTDSMVLADASGGSFTLTLPGPAVGQEFTIKQVNSSGGTVTVSGGAVLIDGSATAPLIAKESLTVVSDGANWYVV